MYVSVMGNRLFLWLPKNCFVWHLHIKVSLTQLYEMIAVVILGIFSLGCINPSLMKKSAKPQPLSILHVFLKQNSVRKCNVFARRMGSYTVVYRKSCHLVWKRFSNLMGCSRENITTLVICLFFFDYIIEWCISWLWQIISCALQNIQSTNWQTMRFKPPPPNSDIGWRVEFRPMEVRKTSVCTKVFF